MSWALLYPTREAVAFGRRGVPRLFEQLLHHGTVERLRALETLCDLMLDPRRVCEAVNGGFLWQLKQLLRTTERSVREKVCELLYVMTGHDNGRRALLEDLFLLPLADLLDDPSPICRKFVYKLLWRFTLLPAGGGPLLDLTTKLMIKLAEEKDEEMQLLLLTTLNCCFMLEPLVGLHSEGVNLLAEKLKHASPNIRRDAAEALMALSVPLDGKREICEKGVLQILVKLLRDKDIDVRVNAAGVLMFTTIITRGKLDCLELDTLPTLLEIVCSADETEDLEKKARRKTLVQYSFRALSNLAEAPMGRRQLLEELPKLKERYAEEKDPDICHVYDNTVQIITWKP